MKISEFDNTETLVFISGMFAGSWIWEDACRQIKRTKNLLIDEPLCAIGEDVDAITDDIVRHLEALNRPVTIVGNSLGSLVGLQVAASTPELVKKVFISGSAGFGRVSLDIKLLRHDPEKTAEDLVKLILHDKSKVSPKVCYKTAESFSANFKNIIKLIKESHEIDAREILSKVKCPVHAIWGSHDMITPYEETVAALQDFKVESSIIDGCGHSPMFEKPNEFASVINQHLY